MRLVDEQMALALVERGGTFAPLDRAVLLAAAISGVSAAEAADLPLDRRDRLLIDARIAAFGPQVALYASCPQCGEPGEAAFDLGGLPPASPQASVTAPLAGHTVGLRAPTSREVAEAVRDRRPERLAAACLEAGGPPVATDLGTVEAAVEQAFPLLDIRVALACGTCATATAVRFDIAAWLWREVEALARRAVDAVDRLARTYGWSEAEILQLTPGRRALYLAKVAP